MVKPLMMFCSISLCLFAGQQLALPPVNELEHHVSSDMLPHIDLSVFHDSNYVDSIIRLRMSFYHIPGAATLVVKDGQIIWQAPFGYAYTHDSLFVSDTTIFTMASVSKTIVAWAIMRLWERGLFGLDDNINDYLPFQVIHPAYPDSMISFRKLMAHTSGIRDAWSTLLPLMPLGHDSPIALGQFLQDYLVSGGLYYDPDSNFSTNPPGTAWEYCNVGISLLAYVVEIMADSFPVYCRDSIFDRLGMNRSCWFLSELDTMDMAMPYHWNGSTYVPCGHYGCPFYPAGFLKTSVPQLARSFQAFMQHGQIDSIRLLDSTTVEMMTTVQYPAIDSTWGLIWYKMWLYERELWGHSGGFYGIGNFQFYCPAENTGVIVLTNGESWVGICQIADLLFDYAAEYSIAEKPTTHEINALSCQIPTIFSGPMRLPAGKSCRVFDITGRVVMLEAMKAGVYFIENDGKIVQKVIKVR